MFLGLFLTSTVKITCALESQAVLITLPEDNHSFPKANAFGSKQRPEAEDVSQSALVEPMAVAPEKNVDEGSNSDKSVCCFALHQLYLYLMIRRSLMVLRLLHRSNMTSIKWVKDNGKASSTSAKQLLDWDEEMMLRRMEYFENTEGLESPKKKNKISLFLREFDLYLFVLQLIFQLILFREICLFFNEIISSWLIIMLSDTLTFLYLVLTICLVFPNCLFWGEVSKKVTEVLVKTFTQESIPFTHNNRV